MTSIVQMWECRRTARSLQRFLDRDPAAPLSEVDLERVEIHLAECKKCTALSEECQALHQALQHLGEAMQPGPDSVDRVRLALERAIESEER